MSRVQKPRNKYMNTVRYHNSLITGPSKITKSRLSDEELAKLREVLEEDRILHGPKDDQEKYY